jgi:endonuclease/exonuclease/phosphatase family metal-dependent hydrolase
MPSTFRSALPAFRIDYIFNDAHFEAKQFYIPKVRYSDHYPAVATFSMNNE